MDIQLIILTANKELKSKVEPDAKKFKSINVEAVDSHRTVREAETHSNRIN